MTLSMYVACPMMSWSKCQLAGAFELLKAVWSLLTWVSWTGACVLHHHGAAGEQAATWEQNTKSNVFSSPRGYAGNLKIQLECSWAVTSSRRCRQSRRGSRRRYLAGAWRPGVAPSPGGGSASVSLWLSVASANVPVPTSLAGYQEVAPSFASVSPSPGATVGTTSRSTGGDKLCVISVIDCPQPPSEGMIKMTLFPFRLDSVQRLRLKIELPQSFQAAGPVLGSGFPMGCAPRPWKGKCIPGLGQRLGYGLGQGHCCNSRSDSEGQWASGSVVLGQLDPTRGIALLPLAAQQLFPVPRLRW